MTDVGCAVKVGVTSNPVVKIFEFRYASLVIYVIKHILKYGQTDVAEKVI